MDVVSSESFPPPILHPIIPCHHPIPSPPLHRLSLRVRRRAAKSVTVRMVVASLCARWNDWPACIPPPFQRSQRETLRGEAHLEYATTTCAQDQTKHRAIEHRARPAFSSLPSPPHQSFNHSITQSLISPSLLLHSHSSSSSYSTPFCPFCHLSSRHLCHRRLLLVAPRSSHIPFSPSILSSRRPPPLCPSVSFPSTTPHAPPAFACFTFSVSSSTHSFPLANGMMECERRHWA